MRTCVIASSCWNLKNRGKEISAWALWLVFIKCYGKCSWYRRTKSLREEYYWRAFGILFFLFFDICMSWRIQPVHKRITVAKLLKNCDIHGSQLAGKLLEHDIKNLIKKKSASHFLSSGFIMRPRGWAYGVLILCEPCWFDVLAAAKGYEGKWANGWWFNEKQETR